MKRRDFNFALAAVAAAPTVLGSAAASAAAASWSFSADVAESCSCAIPCPCNFGRPTKSVCEGSRLIRINDGNITGTDLAGIGFVATFHMGEWVRIYVDDALSEAQNKAFDALFPLAFGGFRKLMISTERVPLTIVREGDRVRFEVPESTVEIAMVRGLNDQPITIDGLPSAAFHNYTQYESVVHKHHSSKASFEHSGTNGFTSTMIASG